MHRTIRQNKSTHIVTMMMMSNNNSLTIHKTRIVTRDNVPTMIQRQHITIVRPEYAHKVKEVYKQYMILYEYNDEEDREYDDEQEVFDDMIEQFLNTVIISRRVDNPLEKQLIHTLRHYWNLYTRDDLEL